MRKLLFTVLMLLPFMSCEKATTEEIQYYESGAISGKSNFVDGVKQGEEIEYYESGAVKSKVNYVDGKEQGEGILYFESGAIQVKGNYVDGVFINNK